MQASMLIGIAALVLFAGIGVYLAPLEPSILCLQFAFTESSFLSVIDQWQPAGVALYRSHFPVDFMLLVAYGSFGRVYGKELILLRSLEGGLAALLCWALPVAALADAAENVLHLVLTGGGDPDAPVFYAISGAAASAKWLGVVVFAVCVIVGRRKPAG